MKLYWHKTDAPIHGVEDVSRFEAKIESNFNGGEEYTLTVREDDRTMLILLTNPDGEELVIEALALGPEAPE